MKSKFFSPAAGFFNLAYFNVARFSIIVLFVTLTKEVKKIFACGWLSFTYFYFAHFSINVLFVTVTKEVKNYIYFNFAHYSINILFVTNKLSQKISCGPSSFLCLNFLRDVIHFVCCCDKCRTKISPTHTFSHFHFIRRMQKDFPGLDPGPHWAKPPDPLIASRYRTRISILCYKYILLLEDTDASAYWYK